MILVDTSVLIDALTGPRNSAPLLRAVIERGERMLLPAPVLYEWLRGPRFKAEIDAQEALFPSESAVPFGGTEAVAASKLYKSVRRPRGREINIAIAAIAISRDMDLWTLNARDFADLPGLRLFSP
jgi:predicted nucleic acid-binding protein